MQGPIRATVTDGTPSDNDDLVLFATRISAQLSELKPDQPRGYPYSRKVTDGWTETAQTGVAYAVTHDGQNVKVYSNICTHLQCRASWKDDRRIFFCPCHDGVYSIDGEVISGPPPRPLDQFETKIENGQISILLT